MFTIILVCLLNPLVLPQSILPIGMFHVTLNKLENLIISVSENYRKLVDHVNTEIWDLKMHLAKKAF